MSGQLRMGADSVSTCRQLTDEKIRSIIYRSSSWQLHLGLNVFGDDTHLVVNHSRNLEGRPISSISVTRSDRNLTWKTLGLDLRVVQISVRIAQSLTVSFSEVSRMN